MDRQCGEYFDCGTECQTERGTERRFSKRCVPSTRKIETLLREGTFTFVHQEGMEPTNHAAERALRHSVLWRIRMLRHRQP